MLTTSKYLGMYYLGNFTLKAWRAALLPLEEIAQRTSASLRGITIPAHESIPWSTSIGRDPIVSSFSNKVKMHQLHFTRSCHPFRMHLFQLPLMLATTCVCLLNCSSSLANLHLRLLQRRRRLFHWGIVHHSRILRGGEREASSIDLCAPLRLVEGRFDQFHEHGVAAFGTRDRAVDGVVFGSSAAL